MSSRHDSYYAQGLSDDAVDVADEGKDPDAAGTSVPYNPTSCFSGPFYVWGWLSVEADELLRQNVEGLCLDSDLPSFSLGSSITVRPISAWKLSRGLTYLIGLLVLYVIVLSAALDLVPAYVPKGVVAFFNIAPAFAAKVLWPIFSRGNIRYSRRLFGCCAFSVTGMIVRPWFTHTPHLTKAP